jgi:hypothetical protein
MKSWAKTFALVLAGPALLVLVARAQQNDSPPPPDSVVQLTAETRGLNMVAPSNLPEDGTFWMVTTNGLMAPWPCPPSNPTMPIYGIADGQFLVDATGGKLTTDGQQSVADALAALAGQVNDLITKVQTYAARQAMRAMGIMPDPGDGEEGGGELPTNNICLVIDTNSLWLEITNVANGRASLNLHNATNQVYEIWSKTDLSQINWDIEQELSPTDPTVMSFTVPTLDRTNLFIWARDWTGITSHGNTTPEWWFWKYFGTVDLSDSNLDSDGITLLSDYTNNIEPPNAISFTVRLGNQHFNTASASGSYLVLNGIPSSEAVLVNDENFSNAVWQPYDGTVHLSLGATDAVYQVWMGLKGFGPNAQPTWIGTAVYMDRLPPSVAITNPIIVNGAATTAVPYVQVQGFASESLQSITFDLSNAVSIVSHQPGQILGGQFFDTNQWAYTTNYFQCFDVPLTNGLNTIIVHATDLAGNVTVTNLNITLDYATATNPVIDVYWPQNGRQISGSNFTWRGWVNDPTAQVTAQIVAAGGDTNTVQGIVERDGKCWVENLPLSAGTNWLTLSVTNAAGLASMTNIMVIQSTVDLTIDPVNDDLWLPMVKVSGQLSDTNYTVWINGVTAVVTPSGNGSDGSWSADKVPIDPGGTATLNITLYPPDHDLGGGSGGGTGGSGGAGSANPSDPSTPSIELNLEKPSEVVLESAHRTDFTFDDGPQPEGMVHAYLTWNYSAMTGGTFHELAKLYDKNGVFQSQETYDYLYAPDKSFISGHINYGDGDPFDITSGVGRLDIPLELGALNYQVNHGYWKEMKTSQVRYVIRIRGKGTLGSEVLVASGIGSGTEVLMTTPGFRGIDNGNLTVEGFGKTLDADGMAFGRSAAGSAVSINLTAPVPYHIFANAASDCMPTWECVATTPTNRTRTTIGVCEEVDLSLQPPPPSSCKVSWATTSGTLSDTRLMAPDTPDTAKVTATVTDVSGRSTEIHFPPFGVIKPSGAILENVSGTLTTNINPLYAEVRASWYIPPDSVSFYNVKIAEGKTNAITTGYFYPTLSGYPHIPGSDAQGSTVIVGKGTFCSGYDENHYDDISAGAYPPYTNGTFVWHIPWFYITPRGTTNYFITVDHLATLTATSTNNATLVLQKGGAGGSVTTH